MQQWPRYIEGLRRLHKKDEEVWIIGCGGRLDEFPDNFFDDKVSIALNWAFIAFPDCTYLLNYHIVNTDFIMTHLPDFAKKWILWFPPEDPKNGEWAKKFKPMLMQRSIERTTKPEEVNEAVKAIMCGRPYKYVDTNTIAHAGIQAAAILGAKRITLVGCEHEYPGIGHAQKRGMRIFYRNPVGRARRRKKLGTTWFMEALKHYGVEVKRYNYQRGYEEIPGWKELEYQLKGLDLTY